MTTVKSYRMYLVFAFTLLIGFGAALTLPKLASSHSQAANDEIVEQFNPPDAASIYYVSKDGDGSDGLNWTTAYTSMQFIMPSYGDEIWVASGVYTPGLDQIDSFFLYPGVAIYGGFPGTPGSEGDFGVRDWKTHLTVLSGDIHGDDTSTGGVVMTPTHIAGTNVYHVVHASGVTGTAVLDGFTITAGKADGGSDPHFFGGGLYCNGFGVGNTCSPNLKNIIFAGNLADEGGAMYNNGALDGSSSPHLTNVTFSGNHADGLGGAMVNNGNEGGDSSPELNNVTFSGNSAGSVAGAMYNASSENGSSSPILTNVTFSGNSAVENGGAMVNSGSENGNTSPILTNVTFSGNSAGEPGGVMLNSGFNGTCAPEVRNSIFWNNQDNHGSKPFFNNDAVITLSNSLVQGAFSGGSWIGGSYVDGGGNIDTDPLFVTPVDPSSAPTTTGDLRLKINSPALNAGNNSYVTALFDLDGNDRIVAGTVDMGAYENQNEYPFENYMPLIKR